MEWKSVLLMLLLGASLSGRCLEIRRYQLPYQDKLSEGQTIEGTIKIVLDTTVFNNTTVDRNFYGGDLQGFAPMPNANPVLPLDLGFVKSGGNEHSVFSWVLNSYYDANMQLFVETQPLIFRMKTIKNTYKANPLLQVNLMGWRPDVNDRGVKGLMETATAEEAGKELLFLNKENNIGVQNILVGNEPFDWQTTHPDVWRRAPISADEHIDRFIKFAVALRAAQEAATGNAYDVKIWGPEMANGYNGWQTNDMNECHYDDLIKGKLNCSYGNGEFDHFVPYFLHRLKLAESDVNLNPKGYKLLDYLTLHYYPLFRTKFPDVTSIIRDKNGREDIVSMLNSTSVWDEKDFVNEHDYSSPRNESPFILGKFKEWRNKYYPEAELAVTEYGIDSMINIHYHSIVRPIYLADLVGRVAQMGYKTFVNSFLNTNPMVRESFWSMLDRHEAQTNLFPVFQLYSRYYRGEVLPAYDTFGKWVNAYAVFKKQEDGSKTINVMVVNKDAVKRNASIVLNVPSSNRETEVLQLELAPWSLAVLEISTQEGRPIKVSQFGAKEMGIRADNYYSSKIAE